MISKFLEFAKYENKTIKPRATPKKQLYSKRRCQISVKSGHQHSTMFNVFKSD